MTTTTPRRAKQQPMPSHEAPGGVTTARPQASQHAPTEERPPGGAHDTRRAIDLAVTISIPPAGYHHAGRQVSVVPLVSNASGIPLSRPALEAPSPRTRAPGGVQLVERQDASEAQSSCALGVQPAGGPASRVAQTIAAAGVYSRPAKAAASPVAVSRGGHLLAGRQWVSDAQGDDAASVLPADRPGTPDARLTSAVGSYSRLPNQLAVTTAHPADGALHAGHHLSVDARGANVASVQPADRPGVRDPHSGTAVGFYVTQASVATQPTGTKREPPRRSAS